MLSLGTSALKGREHVRRTAALVTDHQRFLRGGVSWLSFARCDMGPEPNWRWLAGFVRALEEGRQERRSKQPRAGNAG